MFPPSANFYIFTMAALPPTAPAPPQPMTELKDWLLRSLSAKEMAEEFDALQAGDFYPMTAPFRAVYEEWRAHCNDYYKHCSEYYEHTRPEREAREEEAQRSKEAEAKEAEANAKAERAREMKERKAAAKIARGGLTKSEFREAKKQRR